MYTKNVTIVNASGLHARPASEFVTTAKRYSSAIKIRRIAEEKPTNAKSIVMLLAMGLMKDTEVEISASGEDEKEAVDTLVSLIESGFGD